MKLIELPGMEARVELAKARILATIYGEGSEMHSEQMMEVAISAECLGRNDFYSGDAMPGMFAGEPVLIKLWNQGYDASALMDEMGDCEHCNDGSGDPCPMHG